MSVRRNLSIVLLYLALGLVTCNCKLAPPRDVGINSNSGSYQNFELLTRELSCPADGGTGAPAPDTDKLIAQILAIDGSSLLKVPLYQVTADEEQVVTPSSEGEDTEEGGLGLQEEGEEEEDLTEEDIWNPNWGEGDEQDDFEEDDADYEEELEEEDEDDEDYWIGDDDWEDDFDYIDNKETDDNSEE